MERILADRDQLYMRRCFELARKGLGFTRTNPLVGCVIVHRDRIIGEGYHHEFGGPHAEVVALRSVKDASVLPESTLYCNLEPCAHQGKTPPCSLLITQKGIGRLVIANLDPFPSVNGQGIKQLEDAGVQVVSGCLEEEGAFLNRRFLIYHTKRRPYIVLKWAQSLDGFLDLERGPGDQEGPRWITGEACRSMVHKWRSEEAGIMIGTHTAVIDNPQLNIRRWTGENPVRITIDRKGRIPKGANILDGNQDTIVFSGVPVKYPGRTRSILVDPSYELGDLLEELYDQQIISVLVEGGALLLDSFLKTGLWDEARVFTGRMSFSQGVKAPELDEKPDEMIQLSDTKLEFFINREQQFKG